MRTPDAVYLQRSQSGAVPQGSISFSIFKVSSLLRRCLHKILKIRRTDSRGSLWKREPRSSPARIASWNDERDVTRPSDGGTRYAVFSSRFFFRFPFSGAFIWKTPNGNSQNGARGWAIMRFSSAFCCLLHGHPAGNSSLRGIVTQGVEGRGAGENRRDRYACRTQRFSYPENSR